MPVSEIVALLESRLRRGRAHLVGRALLFGLARAGAVAGAALLAVLLAATALAGFPQLFPALAAGAAVTVLGALAWFVVVPWLARPDLGGFARLAERRLPPLRSLLVNALELAPVARGARPAAGNTSPELAAALVAQAEERSRAVDFAALAPARLPRAWIRALIVVAALWVAGFAIAPGPLSRSAWALLHPRLASSAAVTLAVWPGDVTLAPGATLRVGARVLGAAARPTLLFRAGGDPRRVPMTPGAPPADSGVRGSRSDPGGAGRVYQGAIAALAAPGEYAVQAAGKRSAWYRVRLAGSAAPVSFEITYRYPPYTRLPAETQAATRADLVALRGTRATVTVNLDRGVDAVTWTLGSALRSADGRRWVGETTVSRDGPYELAVRAGGRVSRFAFRTEAEPDRLPLLAVSAPVGDQDLPAGQRIPIAASGSDDFGLTQLALAYERSTGGGGRVVLARWPGEPREATAQTEWDLSGLGLLPGQSVSFVLELTDNDRVSGPKTARSMRYTVRFPALSELYDEIKSQQESAADKLDRALQEARELSRQVDDVQRDLTQNPRDMHGDASWEKRQAAKEAADRQQAISDKLQEVTQQLEDASRSAAEHQAFRDDILAKMQEISKLVAELQSPELKEAIRQLQESLSQVDPRRLQANLNRLQNAQEELMRGLERTAELLKRVRQEEKLESAARRAEELARREQSLDKQMADARQAEERERLAKAQEQAQRESQSLQQDLDQLAKELSESHDAKTAQQAQESAQKLEQEAQPALQQSAQQMRGAQSSQARQSAARARQAFQQVAQQLDQAHQQMSGEEQRQMAEAVRRSAQDLLDLSKKQEQGLAQGGDPRAQAQRQEDMREGAERVADDLMQMAKKTPFFPPGAQQSLGRALERLEKSRQAFSSGDPGEGQQQGKSASSAFNQTVVELRQAEQQMCQGGQGQGQPGKQSQAGEQVQALSGQQGELNQDTQSLIERLTQQQRIMAGDQSSLEQLAARQEAIRRGVEEALKSQGEGEILGRLGDARKDMEEVERDLKQGRIDAPVPERQNRILSRLLDAQRSVNRREYDERRESRSGVDVARVSPPPIPQALLQPGARVERDLLRARAERYPLEFRDLVESYLRRLQEGR